MNDSFDHVAIDSLAIDSRTVFVILVAVCFAVPAILDSLERSKQRRETLKACRNAAKDILVWTCRFDGHYIF